MINLFIKFLNINNNYQKIIKSLYKLNNNQKLDKISYNH